MPAKDELYCLSDDTCRNSRFGLIIHYDGNTRWKEHIGAIANLHNLSWS